MSLADGVLTIAWDRRTDAADREPQAGIADTHLPQVGAGTFRGGKGEPLHEWFHYPEAFSPQFVRWARSRFAPEAKTVLDPIAGIGTTPITAYADGIESYYCELNPLLQTLINAKVRYGEGEHVSVDGPRHARR